eukprot:gb/GECG01010092.1/.p1 GENE.gb/GECG01010092.1/~~gb/GECG01010092.1/.p1  ORF type:complete len:187 (+),score=17.55 gb/GECG01010092.1/:1-561(+)
MTPTATATRIAKRGTSIARVASNGASSTMFSIGSIKTGWTFRAHSFKSKLIAVDRPRQQLFSGSTLFTSFTKQFVCIRHVWSHYLSAEKSPSLEQSSFRSHSLIPKRRCPTDNLVASKLIFSISSVSQQHIFSSLIIHSQVAETESAKAALLCLSVDRSGIATSAFFRALPKHEKSHFGIEKIAPW